MRKFLFVLLAIAALLIIGIFMLKSSSSDDAQIADQALIQTPQGPVQGVTTEDPDIYNFKGLPFAAAPVGDLRWRAPEPASAWTQTRTADRFGQRCMQPADTEGGFFDRLIEGHGLGAMKEFLIRRVTAMQEPAPMGEDCLYLNVRSGNLGGDQLQPVMVWIHGGGHQFGSSDFNYYQSNGLVKKDVVLVTINYRLGAFGYLAHPALSEDDPNGVSGNYGTLDQIAALKWVRDNISAYGGDPDNVTIFGESAGGWSVTELMASPLAKGLFHKAIGQSGASSYHLGQLAENPLGWISGYESGLELTTALGLENPDAETLRDLPADDIMAVLTEKMSDGFHHNRDGYVFPDNVGISFLNGTHNAVPTLFGYNADEGTLFFDDDPNPTVWIEGFPASDRQKQIKALSEHFPTQAETLVDLYGLDRDFEQGGMDMMGDEIFGVNIRFVTRQNAQSGQPAYSYFFSRVPPSETQTLGAFHAAEIAFAFDSHEGILGLTDSDAALTEMMTGYWSNFARTGNPNGPGLPEWKPHEGEHWMHFSANTDRASGPEKLIRDAKLNALEEGLRVKLTGLQSALEQTPPALDAGGQQ